MAVPVCAIATMDALLNANYLRALLEPYYDLPLKGQTMHECVFSDERQAKLGVRTGDIAKRLIDYGFHPYTVSFPLIVKGRDDDRADRDRRQAGTGPVRRRADLHRAKRSRDDPQMVLKAPHLTRTSRVDEVSAARKPVVRWKRESTSRQGCGLTRRIQIPKETSHGKVR